MFLDTHATKSFHYQLDAVVEETGTSHPLGEWVRQQWNRNYRWVWLPGVLDHACGIGVTELGGLATEHSKWYPCIGRHAAFGTPPDSCAIDKQEETNML